MNNSSLARVVWYRILQCQVINVKYYNVNLALQTAVIDFSFQGNWDADFRIGISNIFLVFFLTNSLVFLISR